MIKSILLALSLLITPATAGNYFTQSMLSSVSPAGLQVVQPTTCPKNNTITNSTYKYFVLSGCHPSNLTTMASYTWTGGYVMADLLEMRDPYTHAHNPNSAVPPVTVSGQECFVVPTTIPNAMAVSQSMWAYTLGAPTSNSDGMGYQDLAGSLPVYTWAYFNANAASMCSAGSGVLAGKLIAQDIVVEPETRVVDVAVPTGCVMPDYEPHDGRTDAQTTTEVTAEAGIAVYYGGCFELYTNPLNGSDATYDGWDSTSAAAAMADSNVSRFFVLLGDTGASVSASWATQTAMLGSSDCSRIGVTVDMGKITLADAYTINGLLQTCGSGVVFWLDGQTAGGEDTPFNENEAAILGLPTP